jgi:hypothetical protein
MEEVVADMKIEGIRSRWMGHLSVYGKVTLGMPLFYRG